MKKIIAVIFVSFVLIFAGSLGAETPMPAWVQSPPQNTANMLYFLGMSDRAANYGNFLEAKAGALADVLFQFSAHRGAELNSTLTDISDQIFNFNEQKLEALLESQNESAGLYQQAEWIDRDGTLYVLYNYTTGSRTNPQPDLTDAFERVTFSNDRIYFTALAVSPQNNAELARQAEQNARVQALIWLGANIEMEFEENMHVDSSGFYGIRFNGGIVAASRVNLPALAFREESRRITRGQDNRFYHYGIYSISNVRPGSAAEFDFFEYIVEYDNYDIDGENFKKNGDFNGTVFERTAPYTPRPAAGAAQAGMPGPVANLISNPSANVLMGIGTEQNASIEAQRLIAGIRAISEIGRMLSSTVNAEITEDNMGNIINDRAVITTSISISRLERAIDLLAPDNIAWQVWTLRR